MPSVGLPSLLAAGPTSDSPQQSSPDGAMVPPETQIIDNTGSAWTIASSGAILRDGLQAANGAGSKILWARDTVYVLGTNNSWYAWTGITWTFVGSAIAPVIVASPDGSNVASPDGSMVPTLTQVTDNAGAEWSIGWGGAILRDGVQAGNGAGSTILWAHDTIYVLGTDDRWYAWSGNTWTHVDSTGAPVNVASPDGSAVPTLTQITDSAGAVWSIGSHGAILRDGIQAANGAGSTILWAHNIIYVLGIDNAWYAWNGSNWEFDGTTQPGEALPQSPPPPSDQDQSASSSAKIPSWGPDAIEAYTGRDGLFAILISPSPQMHFTAGQPLRFFGDVGDPDERTCGGPGAPPFYCTQNNMTFTVDGAPVGTIGMDPNNQDKWLFTLTGGLTAGDHTVGCRYQPVGGSAFTCSNTRVIHVDPPPVHAQTITLSADMIITSDIVLSDVTIIGDGHKIVLNGGSLALENAALFGLGSETVNSIEGATAAFSLTNVLHEASGPIVVTANGATVQRSEFRANNLVYFSASDPRTGVILQLTSNGVGGVLKGVNTGSGQVVLGGNQPWQIGGLTAADSVVIMGVRGALAVNSAGSIVQGVYANHHYPTGFSQGQQLTGVFNWQGTSDWDGFTVEHSVLAGGSWILQMFGGELRNSLLVGWGVHNLWRIGYDGTRVHHNVWDYYGPDCCTNGLLWFYRGERNLRLDHNTFLGKDAYPNAVVRLDGGSTLASFEHNLSVGFASTITPLITASAAGSVVAADYNGWFNMAGSTPYQSGVVVSQGAHDITADPAFAGGRPMTAFNVDEGVVWTRQFSVFDVLHAIGAYYAATNTAFSDIGAIGAGSQFGSIVSPGSGQFGTTTGAVAVAPR